MDAPLKPRHVKRYKDIASLVVKYKRSGLGDQPADDTTAAGDADPAQKKAAEQLVEQLEHMGPTFVKLGQLLSTRADFLPPVAILALERLQDKLEPFDFEQVEEIVSKELDVRISKAFDTFDEKPLAAASLGQVHRATLRDGRQVVVKVQRPGIREKMDDDLEAFAGIAQLLDHRTDAGRKYHFAELLEEFRRTLLAELDYLREARNLKTLGRNLRNFPLIVVPSPVDDYTSSRVLTMEYVQGTKVTELSPVAMLELNGPRLAESLFRAYLKQIFVDGFFHADPHPGNVFVTGDGRVALIDLGMVAHIAPRMQEQLLQILLAVADGRSDDASDVALKISEQDEGFDERLFRRRMTEVVSRNRDVSVADMQVGRAVMEIARTAGASGVHPPPEITVLGKALLNLDQIGRTLSPDFDPNRSIRRNAVKIMKQRMIKMVSPANLFTTALEVKDLATRLPQRVNQILDATAKGQIGIKVDTGIDPAHLLVGLQKVANRIAMGLVVAALIMGAAMLMHVPTRFTIWGYPGIAMLCFLAAAAIGVMMIVMMVWKDIPTRKAKKALDPGG